MISSIFQYWLRSLRPTLSAVVTRFIYSGSNIRIHNGFRVDKVPRLLIDKTAQIEIGENVEFREGVEIRAHGNSNITIENNVRIDRGVRILANNNAHLRIGEGSRIGLYAVLNGGDDIDVGKRCLISGFVYLQTSNHRFSDSKVPIASQGYTHAPIVLESGVWLAAHVVVMPGVTIGSNTVVGSNAVVTRSIPPRVVVGGIPATIIKGSQ